MMPANNSSLDGIGSAPVGLDVGSRVVGFFIDGNEKQFPMIIGSFHTIPGNNISRHGVSSLSRGINDIEKESIGPEPEPSYGAQYPYNKVHKSKSGHVVEIDDTPGNERLHMYHKSGSYTEINSNGRRSTKIVDSDIEVVIKDKNIYIHEGDFTIHTNKGNITIKSKGKITLESEDDVDIKSTNINLVGEDKISVTAKEIDLNSDSRVNISSDLVNIDSKVTKISSSVSITLDAPSVKISGL
jgi:hypothetical protein